MPRTYVSTAKKRYTHHDPEKIRQAVEAITTNQMSYREAARRFSIPKTVLVRHKNGNVKKHGGQTILTNEEEILLIENINVCADWGYPIDTYDFQLLVKNYLDNLGKTIARFRNNLPGKEFVYGFLNRHKNQISNRMCQNIKRSRANISRDIVNEYFNNLSEALNDVPPTHIINYDETNLTDDVGKKKVIVKRGCKHPERVMNTSKSATSLMFAATGDGVLLPPYVVYKSQNLYDSWTEGGPTNSRYNRTASGWFDMECFEDWIMTTVIPYFRRLDGRKILIGDNLASHISMKVIKELQQYNVHMVFLPPNSTHLTQPLDVAFFAPLKRIWRRILLEWKKGPGRKEAGIPKSVFPRLLKQLLKEITPNAKQNIISGFRKTGLIPLSKEEVLKQLPKENLGPQESEACNSSVLTLLKEMRYTEKPKRKSNKKLQIAPGKSVQCDDSASESDVSVFEKELQRNYIDEDFDLVDENYGEIENGDNATMQPDCSDDEVAVISSTKNRNSNCDKSNEMTKNNVPSCSNAQREEQSDLLDFNVGDWVLVKFPVDRPTALIKSRIYIGKITQKSDTSYSGTFLRKKETVSEKGHLYYFPAIPDESEFSIDQVIKKLPYMTERRGLFSFGNVNTKDFESS